MSYRVGLLDTETSHIIAATFSLYPESISHENILSDWFIICAAFKILGEDKITSVSVLDDKKRFKADPKDDYHVIKTLHDWLSTIDVLVGHNAREFDLKKFNARAIYHGLTPIPPLKVVDTLLEARKIFEFTSNRLDYLAKYLGGKGKVKTSPGLWLKVLQGDKAAIKEMVDYNVVDVSELEFVYLKMRPWMHSHPNSNIYNQTTHNCPICGSLNLRKEGWKLGRTGTTMTQQYQCRSCGKWSSGEKMPQQKKIVVK